MKNKCTFVTRSKKASTSSSLISYSNGDAATVLSSNCSINSSGFGSSVALPTFFPEPSKHKFKIMIIKSTTILNLESDTKVNRGARAYLKFSK